MASIRSASLIAAAVSGLLAAQGAPAEGQDRLQDRGWFVTTQHGSANYEVTLKSDAALARARVSADDLQPESRL